MKMVICAANGCYRYNKSDKGKGKGISFFSIPNPRIKPEKDLAHCPQEDGIRNLPWNLQCWLPHMC